MKHNTFKWLNATQFTGALNDNAFKMLSVMTLVKLQGSDNLAAVLAACSALFIIPFLLFSNVAGSLADRFSKRSIIIASKWMEVALLALAIPAFISGAAWPSIRCSSCSAPKAPCLVPPNGVSSRKSLKQATYPKPMPT